MTEQAVPYWPLRLTRRDTDRIQPWLAMEETDIVRQVYITNNGCGPCVMSYDDDKFVDWWPCLFFERTQSGEWGA